MFEKKTCCASLLELILKRNLLVTENRNVQLDYLVNDTAYPGLDATVLLHFNVTILPVHIRFENITHIFTLMRRASIYAQVLKFSCQFMWANSKSDFIHLVNVG